MRRKLSASSTDSIGSLPWVLGFGGLLLAALAPTDFEVVVAFFGLALGAVACWLAKQRIGEVTYTPADMTDAEKRYLFIATKLLLCVVGLGVATFGWLLPQSYFDGWRETFDWHPFADLQFSKNLPIFFGTFAVGIGLTMPARPRVNP